MPLVLILIFVGLGLAQSSRPAPPTHVMRSGDITLHGSVDKVFPLFGPVEEMKWAPGWEPSIKYGSNSEPGTIFTLDDPHPMTWVLSHFDSKSHMLQYVVVGSDRVMEIDIDCHASGSAETKCNFTYSITALLPSAQQAVENYSQEKHAQRLMHLQMAINHYLATGRRLAHHE